MDYLSLAQRSYQLIKSKLLSDEIRPGERLWEDQLAEEISMSRTPVREAVNQLIAERLVRRVPRKGIFAVDYTASEMLDIVATRTIIETQAARLCCQNISEEQMARMDAVLQQYVDMLRSTGQKKANVYDAELHRMLGECSGSALIRRYVEDLENMVVFVRKKDEYVFADVELSILQHSRIVEGILRRDEEAAARAVMENTQQLRRRVHL